MASADENEVFPLRTGYTMFALGLGFSIAAGVTAAGPLMLFLAHPASPTLSDYVFVICFTLACGAFASFMGYLVSYHWKSRMELGEETIWHSGALFGGKPVEAKYSDVVRLERSPAQHGTAYTVKLSDGREIMFTDYIDNYARAASILEEKTGIKF